MQSEETGSSSSSSSSSSTPHAGAGGVLLKGGANLSQQDKQRRGMGKAFRKLDKNKKREETTVLSKDKVSMEKMETLVHLVISQDRTIRQQVQRIKELDREIERYEAIVHFDRIKRHGVNYMQDAYMVELNGEERMKTQLDTSLYIGLRLNTDLRRLKET